MEEGWGMRMDTSEVSPGNVLFLVLRASHLM
jgi:hypothetical protein